MDSTREYRSSSSESLAAIAASSRGDRRANTRGASAGTKSRWYSRRDSVMVATSASVAASRSSTCGATIATSMASSNGLLASGMRPAPPYSTHFVRHSNALTTLPTLPMLLWMYCRTKPVTLAASLPSLSDTASMWVRLHGICDAL